jgi:hypothetical protein
MSKEDCSGASFSTGLPFQYQKEFMPRVMGRVAWFREFTVVDFGGAGFDGSFGLIPGQTSQYGLDVLQWTK